MERHSSLRERSETLKTHRAVIQLSAHVPPDVVHVVVDHWQGDADREHGDHREGDRGVGHDPVSPDAVVELHHLSRSAATTS